MAETETEAPPFAPQSMRTRQRNDEAVRLTEENQRAVAVWAGGRLGIHGVGVQIDNSLGSYTIPLGDWIVKERHTGHIEWYSDERMAELYHYEREDASDGE